MKLIAGYIGVIFCTFVSYVMLGGKLGALWVPWEYVIIAGTGASVFTIANNKKVIKEFPKAVKVAMRGPTDKKDDYLDLLCMLYQVFKVAKTRGMLSLEQHIESPQESTLFQQFPRFHARHHAVEFVCDYLRVASLGAENPHELEDIIDKELEMHHHDENEVGEAIMSISGYFPALGICAAVLGVIKTMGHIAEPPEVLGKMIGSALVGTFLGVWLGYAIVGPIGEAVKNANSHDLAYYDAIKIGLLAHMGGQPPAVSVEFARKALPMSQRPTFMEVEEAQANLPPA